jgi:Domain of unknown function (DUF4926)
MKYKLLDTVVLARDLPQHGLRAGDLGAVVEVYEPEAWRLSSSRHPAKLKLLLL